jgi:hypothetical protein
MSKFIVTTTINRPTSAIKAYANMQGWTLIVVGDKKTPHEAYENMSNVIYLHPDVQDGLYPEFSNALGWNKIARRNIGFIYAYHAGAKIVATVDDDNYPLSNWSSDCLIGKDVTVNCYKTNRDFCDPLFVALNNDDEMCQHDTDNYVIPWHRGFPIQLQTNRVLTNTGMKTINVDIQPMFWSGHPDIDAICRAYDDSYDVLSTRKIESFTTDELVPFNSQNTFIKGSLLPFYFMFPYIGRMEDIWAAYTIHQMHVEHNSSLGILFTRPSVTQYRNDHSISKDIEDELIGYKHSIDFGNKSYKHIIPRESLDCYDSYYNSCTNEITKFNTISHFEKVTLSIPKYEMSALDKELNEQWYIKHK